MVEQSPSREKEPLGLFLRQLEKILVEGNPEGYYKTERSLQRWQGLRELRRRQHGNEALILLFPPDRGHPQFMGFVNALGKAGFFTVDQLLGHKTGIIRGIGPRRAPAARLIIDYFGKR